MLTLLILWLNYTLQIIYSFIIYTQVTADVLIADRRTIGLKRPFLNVKFLRYLIHLSEFKTESRVQIDLRSVCRV